MLGAPIIDEAFIASEESEAAHYIMSNLSTLERLTSDLRHTFELFRHASNLRNELQRPESPDFGSGIGSGSFREDLKIFQDAHEEWAEYSDRYNRWQNLAIMQAIQITYGFGMVLQSINDLLGKSPVLRSRIDVAAKKRGNAMFIKAFRDISLVRLSAAHPGELGSTPIDVVKNSFTGNYSDGAINMSGVINSMVTTTQVYRDGAKYSAAIKNKMVEYILVEDNILILSSVTQAFWDAFLPMESAGSAWARQAAD